MGFHKRHINKELINSTTNFKFISDLVNADCLFMDDWSKNFFNNFNFKYKEYQSNRSKLLEDTKFDSTNQLILNHDNFDKLKSLSNVYINLKSNPSWCDILLVKNILDIKYNEEDSGIFDKLVIYTIYEIDKYYN